MKEQKKRFKLFDSQREGKGVNKEDFSLELNFKRYWQVLRDNIMNKLLSLNIMMILGNFPIIFALLAYIGVGKVAYNAPSSNLLGIITGITNISGEQTAASTAILGIEGVQTVAYANTWLSYLFYGIAALTLFTFGIVNCAAAYVVRNLAIGKPVFLFSDSIDTIKKNWKQALPYGMLDLAICVLIPFNLYTLISGSSAFLSNFLFWTNLLMLILHLTVRWYIYVQIISFNMKLTKIIKNGVYFLGLNAKRNLLAVLGNAIMIGITTLFVFIFSGRFVVISLFIPALMLFSNGAFNHIFAGWKKIDELMVIHDPEELKSLEQTNQ